MVRRSVWGGGGSGPGAVRPRTRGTLPPALVALGAGEIKAVVFVASMVAGMMAFEVIERIKRPSLGDTRGYQKN